MAETLGQVGGRLVMDANSLIDAIKRQEWELAHRDARECARSAGQLLQRLSAMMDVFEEAKSVAEVDRAVRVVK